MPRRRGRRGRSRTRRRSSRRLSAPGGRDGAGPGDEDDPGAWQLAEDQVEVAGHRHPRCWQPPRECGADRLGASRVAAASQSRHDHGHAVKRRKRIQQGIGPCHGDLERDSGEAQRVTGDGDGRLSGAMQPRAASRPAAVDGERAAASGHRCARIHRRACAAAVKLQCLARPVASGPRELHDDGDLQVPTCGIEQGRGLIGQQPQASARIATRRSRSFVSAGVISTMRLS